MLAIRRSPLTSHARRFAAAFSSSSAALESDWGQFPFARPKAADPPAEYAKIRKECPMAKAKLFDGTDIWLLSKLDDVQEVLQDHRFSKVRTHPGFPELAPGAKAAIEGREPTFVDQDPPEHTKFRGFFAPGFTPARGERMRPSIERKVDELIDEMERGSKPANLQEAFSLPFAFKVVYELLGIPFKDYEFLSSNVAVRASASGTARQAAAAQKELTDYMTNLVKEKVKNPKDDLLSEVAESHLSTGHITEEQLVAHAFLLLVAGNATVAGMINLGVTTLLQHPDQLEALKKDPSLWPSAVHELCRYHTASSYALRRVALDDVKLHGKTIKAGEGIIALNQSANRDEEFFLNPDRFDIRRFPNPHVAFGFGTHECVAMYLSHVELQSALRGLFTRLPSLKLAVPASELQYSDPKGDVGLQELPVTW